MAFFALNDIPLPTPIRGLEFVLSTAVSSGRNYQNQVKAEILGRDILKYNNLEWAWLSEQNWRTICSILDSFFVMAKVWHPALGRFVNIQIYPGDRSAQPYWLNGDVPAYYTNCKVNIIDTGNTEIEGVRIGGGNG